MNWRLLEELSMNAHPALQTHLYDGWVLRFSNGYTSRANSVTTLYPSQISLDEKISYCEKIYKAQNLPAVFKLTQASEQSLDKMLDENGYERAYPVNVMTNTISVKSAFKTKAVVSTVINKTWQENDFRLNGVTDSVKKQAAETMQSNIKNEIFSGIIIENEKVIACGLCVKEREYAGLFGIAVDAAYRRRGFGYEICAALLNAAAAAGASTGYLQAGSANTAAISTYKKLGFENYYQYWYRIKK